MASPAAKTRIRAVFFDFMGTCLDWHSAVVRALPAALTEKERSDLALEWRQAFFDDIRSRPPGAMPEDIDVAHARLLRAVLARAANADFSRRFAGEGEDTEAAKTAPAADAAVETAVRAWHRMDAWPDVRAGLERIRTECEGCELFVLANGTTRLQLDLVRSSDLRFNLLFSSQLLGVAKPTPEIYRKALDLVGIGDDPSRAVMVAAHAYDLRAAKAVGLQTIYVRRWTDDLDETDAEKLARENDGRVLDDFAGLADIIRKLGGSQL